jgi:hypothetical protein
LPTIPFVSTTNTPKKKKGKLTDLEFGHHFAQSGHLLLVVLQQAPHLLLARGCAFESLGYILHTPELVLCELSSTAHTARLSAIWSLTNKRRRASAASVCRR